MKPSPTRVTQLVLALSAITSRITTTTTTHRITKPIRLVAVSKLKPLTDIIALASPPSSSSPTLAPNQNPPPPPTTHFGENYVQELLEKSRLLPSFLQGKIHWHFIGGLQSNKAQTLAREVRGLWAVESVDSLKKAKLLDKGRGERLENAAKGRYEEGGEEGGEKEEGKLRVFVQVNTSGEESKSGVQPQSPELLELCRHIRDDCPNLELQGLMTIGAIARSQASSTAETENEDFQCLRETRDWVTEELGLGEGELELSMGMSEDFEAAIRMGSDEVRVGSTIFGERPTKGEARVLPEKGEVGVGK
jgi:PLP dependent protein